MRTKEDDWILCDTVAEIIRWNEHGKPAKLLGVIKNIHDGAEPAIP